MKPHFPLIILWLLVLISSAFGCVCLPTDTDAARIKSANAIFLAKVERISQKRATLKVERVWKGQVSTEVIMLLGGSRFRPKGKKIINYPFTSCDYEFDVGSRYLIYASNLEENYYRTGRCTGTGRVEKPIDEIAQLGKGQLPITIKKQKR